MRRERAVVRLALAAAVALVAFGCSSSPRVVKPGIRDRAHSLEESSHEAALGGDLKRATELERRALAAYRSIDDLEAVAAALNRLGNLQQRRGDAAEAAVSYREARERATEADAPGEEAAAENNLGTLAESAGDRTAARAHYQRSLELARRAGDHAVTAAAENNLGLMDLSENQLDAARARFESALEIDRESANRQGEATRLRNVGALHHRRGAFDEALRALQQAHAIDRDREDVPAIALDLVALSEVRAGSGGDLARAVSERRRAQDIHELLGDEASVRTDQERIRAWCERLGGSAPAECRRP